MTRWTPVFSLAAALTCPLGALADCPPDAIFCDNFNTYCTGGGYPGGAGDAADPDCVSATSPDHALLRSVWFKTSTDEFTGTPCGVEVTADPAAPLSTPPANMFPYDYQVLSSFPFAARVPGKNTELLGQVTLKDWVSPNPLNMSRLIGNAFGNQYTAVAATDEHPLVISFFVSSKGGPAPYAGRIWYSNGYMELGYGDDTYMNRANTDYGLVANPPSSPKCCSPTIDQGPFPVMCANGNPDNPAIALPLNCPVPSTAPVHNAVAVGIFASVDNNPCHCNTAHGGQIYHPVIFDGKLWYEIAQNNPMPSTGWVTLLDGTPVPTPPGDLDGLSKTAYKYGDFVPYGGQPPGINGKSMNWITLTIKSSTFKIEMRSREMSPGNLVEYYVHSSMDNIPRSYLGPFDRLRAGVGPGCELDSSSSWTTCKSGTARHCIQTNGPQSYYVDFDDLTLAGGVGYSTVGACCHSNGTCTQEAPETCQAPGDQHGGGNTSCATSTCCPHDPYVWADADGDGDVDVDDFGKFQLCFTGPDDAMSSDLKCKCFDRGNDNHVDGSDYLEFARCATGASVPWSPELTPFCIP